MTPAIDTETPKGSQRQPWHCYSNFVVCPNDHLLRYKSTNYTADMRRVSGHAFLCCVLCQPHTYFFANYVTTPDPMAICYEISKASFDEWDKGQDSTPTTPELLYRLRDPDGLSYNPKWRPAR